MAGEGGDESGEEGDANNCCPTPSSSRRHINQKIVRPTELLKEAGQAGPGGDEDLVAHKSDRQLDAEAKEFLLKCVKQNRFCKDLESSSLEAIVDTMEYFKFEPGNVVMTQGKSGNYFFVTAEGSFESTSNGKVLETFVKGSSFGEIALLYNTGRASTVVAKEASAVWGADGQTFRKIVRSHSQKQHDDNRAFLDRMSIFDGLHVTKKDKVGHLALFAESCEKGRVIIAEDTHPPAVYFVKSGLVALETSSGEVVEVLKAGDCLGWRAVLYSQPQLYSARVQEHAELVGVGTPQLKDVLGEDIGAVLMHSFLLSVLSKHCAVSRLHALQRQKIAECMELKSFPEGDKLPSDPRLMIVVDGVVTGSRNGQPVTLKRGTWTEDAAFSKLTQEALATQADHNGDNAPDHSHLDDPVSAHRRCRVAMLSKDAVLEALKRAESQVTGDQEHAMHYLQNVLMIQKVPIFGDLSFDQIDALVTALELKTYEKGTNVVTEGEVGEAFFIIAGGDVTVTIKGQHIRDLGRRACFGERALIFGEPRSATVQVTTDKASLWSINREAFRQCVTQSMRDNLAQQINLKDTSVSLKVLKHKRLIGAGSFGSVRLVEHKKTGLRYALKRIRKKDGEVPEEVSHEINILSQIHHPFILTLVTTFETAGSVYLLTELLTGGQLHEQVTEKMGVLSRKHSQFYVGSLSLILEALHERNIVFRDLKPDNVMLDSQGYVKLVDFGLAKKLDPESPRTFTACGTMLYMAPEVLHGEGYGCECDIWSLGVVFFELVCGCYPFGNEADSVDEILCDVLTKPLEIPGRYGDNSGKKLLQGLLTKESEKRIGMGPNGWEDIKSAKFFKQGVSGNLFSQISGRELQAPLCPEGEKYSNEQTLSEEVTLSDADELGQDEAIDFGCRLLATFSKFDLDGDGKIDRKELGMILKKIDANTFTDQVIDELMASIDVNGDDYLCYDEFVAWIVNSDAAELREALRNAVKLDMHA